MADDLNYAIEITVQYAKGAEETLEKIKAAIAEITGTKTVEIEIKANPNNKPLEIQVDSKQIDEAVAKLNTSLVVGVDTGQIDAAIEKIRTTLGNMGVSVTGVTPTTASTLPPLPAEAMAAGGAQATKEAAKELQSLAQEIKDAKAGTDDAEDADSIAKQVRREREHNLRQQGRWTDEALAPIALQSDVKEAAEQKKVSDKEAAEAAKSQAAEAAAILAQQRKDAADEAHIAATLNRVSAGTGWYVNRPEDKAEADAERARLLRENIQSRYGQPDYEDVRIRQAREDNRQAVLAEEEDRKRRTSALRADMQARLGTQAQDAADENAIAARLASVTGGAAAPFMRPEDMSVADANRILALRTNITRRLSDNPAVRGAADENAIAARLSQVSAGNAWYVNRPEDTAVADAERVQNLRENIQSRLTPVAAQAPYREAENALGMGHRSQTYDYWNRQYSAGMANINWSQSEAADFATKRTREFAEELGKTKEPISMVEQGFRSIGAGAWRRGFGEIATGMLGDTPGAAFLGGFAGSIASSLVLPLSWAIGDALMQLPNRAMGEEMAYGSFMAGALNQDELMRYKLIEAHGTEYFSALPGGTDKYRDVLHQFQTLGVDPMKAAEGANRAMLLAIEEGNDPSETAHVYARMLRHSSSETRVAAATQSQLVMEELRKMYPHVGTSAEGEKFIAQLAHTGQIGSEDIQEAYRRAASQQVVQQRADSATDPHKLESFSRYAWDRMWRWIMHPQQTQREAQTDAIMFLLRGKGIHPDDAGDLMGLNGKPWSPTPEENQLKRYSWTSFTGLAEQMQLGYGGIPVQDNTTALNQNTAAVNALTSAMGGSTPAASGGAPVTVGGP